MDDREVKVLAIHGSRSLQDERVKILILEAIDRYNPETLTTCAEPEGVCGVARALCKEIALPLKVCFLNFRYRKGAFYNRSKEIFECSDHILFIHDGTSIGTANELKLAQKMQKKYTYHVLPRAEYDSSVGFEIDIDWDILGDLSCH